MFLTVVEHNHHHNQYQMNLHIIIIIYYYHTTIHNINQINSLLSDESYLSNDLNAFRSVNTLYPLPLYSTLVSVGNETV